MSNIQERVNKVLIHESKVELKEVLTENNIALDPEFKLPAVVNTNETRCVILPQDMNKLQAANSLIQQFVEEETFRSYNRSYDNFFLNDFIVTVAELIPKFFGMLHVSPVDTNGRPAGQNYIQIVVSVDSNDKETTAKGYVGSIKAPVWENAILDIHPGAIIVRAKMKFEASVNNFLAEVENSIRTNSVVKGQTVKPILHPSGRLIAVPINIRENKKIVLSDDNKRVINNLIIPGLREKSKTSLLFTGDFGTGKTESAMRVGKASSDRYGRTFFYLHNSELFPNLIPYIRNYQGAVVFCEDVDQISAGDRDSAMNNLLNQLDGNELKGVNCTFIFTTNNHAKIHPAMRRPGRIDQLVHFDFCTVEQTAEIFKVWVADMNGGNEVDFLAAAKNCPEKLQGAVVAEIARRAIRYAESFHEGVISTDRFMDAIASMREHIEFMRADQKKDHSMENAFGHVMHDALLKAFPHLANEGQGFHSSPYTGLNS